VPRNHVFGLIEIISLLAARRPAVTSHSRKTASGAKRALTGDLLGQFNFLYLLADVAVNAGRKLLNSGA
jgi:hypothetical protein